jgi:hypothetical protein
MNFIRQSVNKKYHLAVCDDSLQPVCGGKALQFKQLDLLAQLPPPIPMVCKRCIASRNKQLKVLAKSVSKKKGGSTYEKQ